MLSLRLLRVFFDRVAQFGLERSSSPLYLRSLHSMGIGHGETGRLTSENLLARWKCEGSNPFPVNNFLV